MKMLDRRFVARNPLRGVLLLATLAAVGCSSGPDPGEPTPRRDAQPLVFEDTITLTNEKVRLGISPRVGRVVDFGLTDGRNVLWRNTDAVYDNPVAGTAVPYQQYFNLGGDKLWPTVQPLWKSATGNNNWPPDGVIDGGAWSVVAQDDDEIVIKSPPSPHYGVVVLRGFKLVAGKPQVIVQNVIQRIEANPFPLSAWTVTQVLPPLSVVLDTTKQAPKLSGGAVQVLSGDDESLIRAHLQPIGQGEGIDWDLDHGGAAKIGTFGRWIAAIYSDVTFLQETEYDPFGAYPDRSSVQAYKGDGYLELELLSPLTQIEPQQRLRHTVVWTLVELDAQYAHPMLLGQERNAQRDAGSD
jgi:hypothetical protein